MKKSVLIKRIAMVCALALAMCCMMGCESLMQQIFNNYTYNASEGLELGLNDGGRNYTVRGIGTCTDTVILIPFKHNGLPVTAIGKLAFSAADKVGGYLPTSREAKIVSVIIPDSVTSIGQHAFMYCTSLTSITIPNSVTSIGENAFTLCTSLASVTIGNSVESIGKGAFSYCSSLTSIEIPDSVTSIGIGVFRDSTSLESVSIGNSVTSISNYAFCNCTSLQSITIPDSVTSIGLHAFSDCTSLISINFEGTVEQWNAIEKSHSWNEAVPATEVVCLNGTVSLK